MNDKDDLKKMCDRCYYEMGLRKVACPFRSISNEYCDEFVEVYKDLEILEILKNNLHLKKIPLSSYLKTAKIEKKYAYLITFKNDEIALDEETEGFDLLKEELENDR